MSPGRSSAGADRLIRAAPDSSESGAVHRRRVGSSGFGALGRYMPPSLGGAYSLPGGTMPSPNPYSVVWFRLSLANRLEFCGLPMGLNQAVEAGVSRSYGAGRNRLLHPTGPRRHRSRRSRVRRGSLVVGQLGDGLNEVHVVAVPVGFGQRQCFPVCFCGELC